MMEKYNINHTTLKMLGFYANHYGKSLHIREIAREAQVDVKAVQQQLKRLERINVLSSTLRGRNKEYSLNLNNPITKYYMVMAEVFISISYLGENFLIKRVFSELGGKIEGAIILFGSFAKGEATEESDIDLFVITEKKLGSGDIGEAGSLVGREINVKSTNGRQFLEGLEERDPLIMEVVSNHIIIKGIENFCDIMWRFHAGR